MPRSSGCEVQRSVINFEILRLNIGDRGHYSTQNGDRNRRNSYPQYGKQSYGDRPQSGQHKRKRDDETGPRDDASRLLASIFRLGDAKPVRPPISLGCIKDAVTSSDSYGIPCRGRRPRSRRISMISTGCSGGTCSMDAQKWCVFAGE